MKENEHDDIELSDIPCDMFSIQYTKSIIYNVQQNQSEEKEKRKTSKHKYTLCLFIVKHNIMATYICLNRSCMWERARNR
jgi:hypothetical protein